MLSTSALFIVCGVLQEVVTGGTFHTRNKLRYYCSWYGILTTNGFKQQFGNARYGHMDFTVTVAGTYCSI